MTMRVSSASEARLLEGIRLYHLIPHARLILSGGRVFGQAADATTMNNVAVMLGIKPRDIEMEPGSQNTEEEARFLKTRLQNTPFILVTSAYHMKRSLYLFQSQGLHPIPAPTQFCTESFKRWTRIFPAASNLSTAGTALHEYLGLLHAYLHQN
ncbi:MAG: hypothetical protein A3J38_02800 [Gammaproteobacteria bacterium RIFCSPHIGHO2_12_FULL_45_9]|nr:MAG: hypothetical protein A3J38_02800 [Gammaproteobacteria bacterium RIFCSPHIGHO2_12_FULL_45_9]